MLWLEPPEEDEGDEDREGEMTAKERFRERQARYRSAIA